ncbi:MAG: hypothetical protein M3N54_04340 [Acidobacteriota bacterium]|nr:hypothetical protein [Acidobacteriota bacterium]
MNRPQPFGPVKVVTPGTTVSLVSTLIANGLCLAGEPVRANKIDIQGMPGNTGNVYIGYAGMNRATLANVIAVLKAGQDWSVTNNVGINTYSLDAMLVDADTAGDGVYGSIDAN